MVLKQENEHRNLKAKYLSLKRRILLYTSAIFAVKPIEAMRIWSLDIVLNVMDIMSIVMIIFLIMNINKKIIGLISDYFYVNL